MRLRAWGPNVEVLLPQELRDGHCVAGRAAAIVSKKTAKKLGKFTEIKPQGEPRPNFMG
jgi:hypothetical protein